MESSQFRDLSNSLPKIQFNWLQLNKFSKVVLDLKFIRFQLTILRLDNWLIQLRVIFYQLTLSQIIRFLLSSHSRISNRPQNLFNNSHHNNNSKNNNNLNNNPNNNNLRNNNNLSHNFSRFPTNNYPSNKRFHNNLCWSIVKEDQALLAQWVLLTYQSRYSITHHKDKSVNLLLLELKDLFHLLTRLDKLLNNNQANNNPNNKEFLIICLILLRISLRENKTPNPRKSSNSLHRLTLFKDRPPATLKLFPNLITSRVLNRDRLDNNHSTTQLLLTREASWNLPPPIMFLFRFSLTNSQHPNTVFRDPITTLLVTMFNLHQWFHPIEDWYPPCNK